MNKQYSKNKKAYHDYEILETIEVGLSLNGLEVKSIRKSNIQLKGSYCSIKENKMFLEGAHISKPKIHEREFFDENRNIPLLINKNQLKHFQEEIKNNGITLVLLSVYQRENTKKIKAELALVKGKREFDKRETLKRRQADIDTKREMKNY